MLPKVVVYNSVSVDGAIKDFDVDIALHYEVAGAIGAQAMLAGSDTAKSGIEIFMKTVPAEQPSDFVKPVIKEDNNRPYWAIADSRAKLRGLLHVYRQSGYGKDVIILVSSTTPKGYLEYLKERNYDYIVAGSDHVDYRAALEELNTRYGISTIVTDTGGVLASVLLEQGLVNEIQLFVAPQIVGKKAVSLFRSLNQPLKLRLTRTKKVKGHALLVYEVR
ncbi:MAG: RibD family protein [Candidatus Bathyarchaeota archaeon]|nr:RibD family protein [Chloroflexota bacterium]MCL5877829.1 RibD family protein [Candidatus Bathyarchaeota archaeon]